MAPSRLLICFLLLFFSLAQAHLDLTYSICRDPYYFGNYSANSTYKHNLHLLLSSLPSKASSNNGFYRASAGGESPDRASAIALCRGDVTPDACHACISNSIVKLLQLCPVQVEAMGGYDECMLWYSNRSVVVVGGGGGGVPAEDYPTFDLWYQSSSNFSSGYPDHRALGDMLGRLRHRAALGDTVRKYFAAEIVNVTSSQRLYGLVQCAPDLTNASCDSCLGVLASTIWSGMERGSLVTPSCNIRYESFLFYGTAAAAAAMASVNIPVSISRGIIAGVSVAAVVGALFLVLLFFQLYKRKIKVQVPFLQATEDHHSEYKHGTYKRPTSFSLKKPREFSYEELSKATNSFNMANKIAQGGFGAVYYAELNGERAAIKKMDMKASKEFIAELKVLTNVHHLNLVRLIGYSTDGSLFLVYEFIENGNLSQLLHGNGTEALSWRARLQIALDAARGLQYIHEQTVPVYIHRDVKSANILIDKNFCAKVADFGLTKLSTVRGGSQNTHLAGTFGYMPPEYAASGDISTKVDVYAFGVVLYELLSGKEAIVKMDEPTTSIVGLVGLFDQAFSKPDPIEDIYKLIDPRIGSNYPLDLVLKMAQLGRACTDKNPQLRPSMRSVVVTLMTLLCLTEDWDAFRGNQDLLYLMSTR